MKKGIIYVYFNKAKYEKEGVEKYYVGQTIGTMKQRAGKDGRGYRIFDETCNSKFARSIRKWGWNSFEGRVLEEVYEEDLNELEKFYIEYFDSFKNGYNTTLGGEGTRGRNPYANKTEEEMEEIKEKKSKIQIKNWKDKELRKKMSKIQRKNWEDKEYREKQKIAQKKRWENAEEKEKITGEKNGRAKSVYCKELNIIFSYTKLAEKYCINILNIKIGPIRHVCNGKRNFTGKLTDGTKLTWNWLEDVDKETLNNAEYIDSKCYEEIINVNKKCLKNPEIKKLQNKRLLYEKNGNVKSVYCNTLNIVFSYIGLAEEYCINILNSKIGPIRAVCNGKVKSTGEYNGIKLTWSWTKNVDKKILDKAKFIDSKKYEEIINERKKYDIPRELNYYTTSVYCKQLNIVFSYIKIAEKYCKNVLNIKIGAIKNVCNSKAKYSGKLSDGTKLIWNWTENLDKETLDNAEYIDSKKYEEIINEKMNN